MSQASRKSPPVSPSIARKSIKAGHIAFDERGNAVFAWDQRLIAEGHDAERQRARALNHPGLALMDDSRPLEAEVFRNERGLKVGYNPYESGLLPDKPAGKKRDMRKLSEWIKLKKKLTGKN